MGRTLWFNEVVDAYYCPGIRIIDYINRNWFFLHILKVGKFNWLLVFLSIAFVDNCDSDYEIVDILKWSGPFLFLGWFKKLDWGILEKSCAGGIGDYSSIVFCEMTTQCWLVQPLRCQWHQIESYPEVRYQLRISGFVTMTDVHIIFAVVNRRLIIVFLLLPEKVLIQLKLLLESRHLRYMATWKRYENDPFTAIYVTTDMSTLDGRQSSTLDMQIVGWTNGVMYLICHTYIRS